LILGVIIRVFIFIVMAPSNPDGHYEIIEHILKFKEIPRSDAYGMAFHPPLYYLLSVPFWWVGGLKCVQLFSLLLSTGTLIVIYFFVKQYKGFTQNTKVLVMAIASFLPSLVTYTLYVSNDSLAIFLGAVYFYAALSFAEGIDYKKVSLLSVILGLGLLAKGTFLVFFVFTLGFVFFYPAPLQKRIQYFLLVLLISLPIGSYKYIQNYLDFGAPFIHNLDFNPGWLKFQRPTILGIKSFLDVNLLKLIKTPCLSKSIRHSVPLLFYSSFWYKQHYLVNNLATIHTQFRFIGSVIYIVGVFPTLFILYGVLGCISYSVINFFKEGTRTDVTLLLKWLTLLVFFLVIYLGAKYDAWSAFHARLIYPAFIGILLLMNDGCIALTKFIPEKWLTSFTVALIIVFIFYYAIEVPLTFMMSGFSTG